MHKKDSYIEAMLYVKFQTKSSIVLVDCKVPSIYSTISCKNKYNKKKNKINKNNRHKNIKQYQHSVRPDSSFPFFSTKSLQVLISQSM